MQIDVEIQEEKIKKEVLSKLKSVRKILWKEKRSDLELEDALKKKFGLNRKAGTRLRAYYGDKK